MGYEHQLKLEQDEIPEELVTRVKTQVENTLVDNLLKLIDDKPELTNSELSDALFLRWKEPFEQIQRVYPNQTLDDLIADALAVVNSPSRSTEWLNTHEKGSWLAQQYGG